MSKSRQPNFRTLDLNLLRVFDAVMIEGSLTRAAGVLALTQSATSHALKRLHEALGEVLFLRTATGLKPTPRAEALWPQVRQALGGLQHALAPDRFDPQTDEVSYRIAMADATAALLTPALVRAIESTRALANLRVLPLTTRDPRPLLEHDTVDLAVGYFPELIAALQTQQEDMLRHERLYDTRFVCVMRRGHPLADQPLTLDAFCAAHHLQVNFSGRPVSPTDRTLADLGRRRRVVLTVNQFFTAGRVVTQSDLLTVLPLSFMAATGRSGDELVTRELPFDPGTAHVEMVWQLRRDGDPAHRWLREVLRAAVQTPQPEG